MHAVTTTGPDALTDDALRRVLDLLPDLVLVVDEAGTVLLSNQQLEPLLGYRPEELLGQPVERLLPERFQRGHTAHRDRYHREPATRAMGSGLDLFARRADGTEIPVDVGLSPVLTEHGVRVITVLRDLTERKRLLELEKRLAHADRLIAVGQLAAGVAHEINNPAAYVMANLTAAEDLLDELEEAMQTGEGFHAEAMVEVLRDVVLQNVDGMKRIQRIVGELQGFSRIEGTGVEELDLKDVVEASARIVGNEVRHKGRLELDLAPVPRMVADGGRLGQVLVDLLVNAVHALPEGRPENLVRVLLRQDGEEAVLAVEDNGAGMDEETRKRVFEPFFTTKPAGMGTGLGLALVADIVHKHGGTIEAHSHPGEGTRMEVRLPLESRLQASPAPAAEPPPRTRRRPGRLLVVDDEPHMLQAMERLLGREHDVVTASSVDEALDALFREREVDVILCDLMLPGRDGIHLREALIEHKPEMVPRLVYTTGGAFTARARDFLATTEHRVLRKPVDVAELRRVIGEVIEEGR